MEQASPLVWFLAVPLGLVIAVAAGSFLLQAACALCNIEDLRFLKALGLMLLLILANAPIGLVLFFMSQGAISGKGWDADPVLAIGLGLGYPLHWLISGLVLFWPLHVSYLKGVLVSILHNVLSLVIAGVLGGVILVVLAFVQLVSA